MEAKIGPKENKKGGDGRRTDGRGKKALSVSGKGGFRGAEIRKVRHVFV